ncbi:MAG TPA: DEAD/DEAH box helicase, partial [Myxococcales bacterium]|nr:DEAD/DEAH box helicase [Myxococcales bacterium]
MVREAFPHQQAGFDAWIAAKRRGSVVLPTGSGKSYLAEMAIAHTQRSTLVVVPTLDLVAQWARRLSLAFDTHVGTIGGGTFDVQDLTVSTYDSAYLHMDRLGNRFGLIVFDEVHHLPSESFSQAAELAIAPFRLGLTATLEHNDGAHTFVDEL